MNTPVKIFSRGIFLAACFLATHLNANVAAPAAAPASVVMVEQAQENDSSSTADHSKFDALKKDFKSGPEVTKACLTCHTEAAKQVTPNTGPGNFLIRRPNRDWARKPSSTISVPR